MPGVRGASPSTSVQLMLHSAALLAGGSLCTLLGCLWHGISAMMKALLAARLCRGVQGWGTTKPTIQGCTHVSGHYVASTIALLARDELMHRHRLQASSHLASQARRATTMAAINSRQRGGLSPRRTYNFTTLEGACRPRRSPLHRHAMRRPAACMRAAPRPAPQQGGGGAERMMQTRRMQGRPRTGNAERAAAVSDRCQHSFIVGHGDLFSFYKVLGENNT